MSLTGGRAEFPTQLESESWAETVNDQTAAELITRSLDEPLSPQELGELESHLAGSVQSRRFAELSQQIQAVVAESRNEEVSSQHGPGLSDLARARLSRELRAALAAQMPLASRGESAMSDSDEPDESSSKRMVAEPETDYGDDVQEEKNKDAEN